MITSAAPSIAGALPGAPGQASAKGAQKAQNGHFAGLLAAEHKGEAKDEATPPASAQAVEQPVPDAAEPAADPATQPKLAASLPLAGKILPVRLPDAAEQPAEPAAEPTPQAPGQTIPPLLTVGATSVPQQTGPEVGAARPADHHTGATESADQDESPNNSAVPYAGWLNPSLPLPPTTPSQTAPAASAQRAAAAPASLPSRAPAEAPAATARSGDTSTAQNTDATALKIDPAATGKTPAAPLVFEAAAAKPMAEVRLRPVLTGEAGSSDTSSAQDGSGLSTGLAASPMGSAALAATAAPATTPVHAPQQQDFAALMDRLIAARDAAQTGLPQNVHVAVNHAEFGQISLNFSHDKAGLAVSLASADPEFARVVQAAIPAPAALASSDSAARDSGRSAGGQFTGNQNGHAAASNGQGPGGQGSGGQGSNGQPSARSDAAMGNGANQRQSRSARAEGIESRVAANPSFASGQSVRRRGIFA